MAESVEFSSSFDDLLNTFLNQGNKDLPLPQEGHERRSYLSQSLEIGETTLKDEHAFTASFLDWMAQEIDVCESFQSYEKRMMENLSPPNKSDPALLIEAIQKLSRVSPAKARSKQAIEQTKNILYAKKSLTYANQKKAQSHGGRVKSDWEGYTSSTIRTFPERSQTFFFTSRRLKITEFYRQRHTIITGGTGSGKSEITKTIVHHYLTKNTNTALVVLDPHGSLSADIAQFKENEKSDRLIYVDLTLKEGFTPVLNPFDVGELSNADFDVVSSQVINLLGVMLSEENQFTDQMKALLKPCVETLLRLPNTNLEHLYQFFDDDRNAPLKRAALKILTNPSNREFMKKDFDSTSYAQTKKSIKTRLQLLLSEERFRNFVVGKSTIDLKAAINGKKLICFKLSIQDSEDPVTLALGRLIVGSLIAITMRRGNLPKPVQELQTPIHLFIDEAHNFSHPTMATILGESRKYKLYLTLISQYIGKFPHARVREELDSNTGLKIGGWQNSNSKGAIANEKLMGITNTSLDRLQTGEFFVKALSNHAFRVKNSSRLVKDNNAMNKKSWLRIIEKQIEAYYRPIQTPEEAQKSFYYSDGGIITPNAPNVPESKYEPFRPAKPLRTYKSPTLPPETDKTKQ